MKKKWFQNLVIQVILNEIILLLQFKLTLLIDLGKQLLLYVNEYIEQALEIENYRALEHQADRLLEEIRINCIF